MKRDLFRSPAARGIATRLTTLGVMLGGVGAVGALAVTTVLLTYPTPATASTRQGSSGAKIPTCTNTQPTDEVCHAPKTCSKTLDECLGPNDTAGKMCPGTWSGGGELLPKGSPCSGGTCSATGSCVPTPPPPAVECAIVRQSALQTLGTLTPDYMILTLAYDPPGKTSSVQYNQGSATGTTTTFSLSDTNGLSASVTAGVKASQSIPIIGTEVASAQFTATVSTGTSVTGSQTYSLATQAVAQSGVQLKSGDDQPMHGEDTFWLWIQPTITSQATVDTTDKKVCVLPKGSVSGGLGVLSLTLNEILGVDQVCPPTAAALAALPATEQQACNMFKALTPTDLAQIAQLDPYVWRATQSAPSLDTTRFTPISSAAGAPQTFAISGPTSATGSSAGGTFSLNQNITWSEGTGQSKSTSYGITLAGQLSAGGVVAGTSGSATTSGSVGNSSAAAQGVQLIASGSLATSTQPASGGVAYRDNVSVYYDTIFNTILFRSLNYGDGPAPLSVSVSGTVRHNGVPSPFTDVVVHLANGTTATVRTDAHGHYHVYGAPPGPVSIVVGGSVVGREIITPGTVARHDLAL